jgi:CheY-like chemotaxis protein
MKASRGLRFYGLRIKTQRFSMEEEVLKGKTLLVVDDEIDLRDIISSELEFMGAKVFQSSNISDAKKVLKNNLIDLIVSDIRMPGGTGLDLLDYLRAEGPRSTPVILITGFADISIEEAFSKGAEALLSKPFQLDDLIKQVERITLPIEQRFIDVKVKGTQFVEIDFGEGLENAMKGLNFLIARGGIAFCLPTQRKRIQIGEVLDFDLKFKDHHFKGTGICRWVKLHEGSHQAALGLEFLNLVPETLEFFLDYWQHHPMIAYVPIPDC